MAFIRINGPTPLSGQVVAGGAKNAALPILAASLLARGTCRLTSVPRLEDVATMCQVIEGLGARVSGLDRGIKVTVDDVYDRVAPEELVRKMRASVLVMGPLLARIGRARIPLPGGCAIGARPIDLHLKGFHAMGAEVSLVDGQVEARAAGLHGASIYLDYPSVGATENLMMAAVLADGETIIEDAAKEPEIVDLATFLLSLGADVHGAGTPVIRIRGVAELHGADHTVIPDRIEAGTYLLAACGTMGRISVHNVVPEHMKAVVAKLRELGAQVEVGERSVHLAMQGKPQPTDLKTFPYPGFPTDLQAPMMAVLTLAPGSSVVTETVFENRFMHASELMRLGARIRMDGRVAIIQGTDHLWGASVRATDLRAGAGLVVAGLMAHGVTDVCDAHHLDRGYDDLTGKLQHLGAHVARVEDDDYFAQRWERIHLR